MILNDLCELYDLKRASEPQEMPERFWCKKQVSWEVTISNNGEALSCVPLRAEDGKHPQVLVVPDAQRTSGIRPFFLCDNAEYVCAFDSRKGAEKQSQFIQFHRDVLANLDDAGAKAFLLFVEGIAKKAVPPVFDCLQEDAKALVVFRLEGDECLIHERAAIHDAWNRFREQADNGMAYGTCLVTGERAQFAKLFPQVTGLAGAQSSGSSLVSCNVASFSSYGQETSTAGPISRESADKAGAALSYILKSRDHRVRIGNDYLGFWTDADSPVVNSLFASFFSRPSQYEDVEVREAVRDAIANIRKGKRPTSIPKDTRFHLLGIAPYQARLSVRFYENDTLGRLMDNIELYLRDTEMVGVEHCSIQSMMEQAAPQGKAENVPSTLIVSTMRALLNGVAFPEALYMQILSRMRVDHAKGNAWDMGRRAAILRAHLVRKERIKNGVQQVPVERRITVGLNEQNNNEGYLLGRLFAILEKIQADANGETNSTIRDRYIGSASTTPAQVFPQLLQLSSHHLRKIDNAAFRTVSDRRIQDVIAMMGDEGFPKTLSIEDQGNFYIGYYQQKKAIYTKGSNQ